MESNDPMIEYWASLCETTEQMAAEAESFEVEPGVEAILRKLQKQCGQKYVEFKKDKFKTYEYEGQHLANCFNILQRIVKQLADGKLDKYVAQDIDKLGSYIASVDAHKSPVPTDPREVK